MQRFGFASAVKLRRVTHKCLIQPPHRAASHFCHEYKKYIDTRFKKPHTAATALLFTTAFNTKWVQNVQPKHTSQGQ